MIPIRLEIPSVTYAGDGQNNGNTTDTVQFFY
jgi:hypothetical protein